MDNYKQQPICVGLDKKGELQWGVKIMELWQQWMFRPVVEGRPRKEIMTQAKDKLGPNGEIQWH